MHFIKFRRFSDNFSAMVITAATDNLCELLRFRFAIRIQVLLFWILDVGLIWYQLNLYRISHPDIPYQSSVQYRNDPISDWKAQYRISDIGDIMSNIYVYQRKSKYDWLSQYGYRPDIVSKSAYSIIFQNTTRIRYFYTLYVPYIDEYVNVYSVTIASLQRPPAWAWPATI
jgi:hypothetical protein